MDKKRVLFVDDEPAILESLADLLRRDRSRWEMVFAGSAAAALEAHRAAPFDVIVTDMRMPGMDGAALLETVMAETPGTARIVLSGHADRDAIVRALPATHQFLSKPCEATVLRAAIERCLDIASQPHGDLRALVGKLDRLPSPSSVFVELTALAKNPNAPIDQIARVIGNDPALAAKVLQLASSSAFGLRNPVTAVRAAVSYLGVELIRCLALTTAVLSDTRPAKVAGFSLEAMQDSALRVAALARKIAPTETDTAFSAGLLHDIGECVLAIGMPARYAEVRRDARAAGESIAAAERRLLGATHADVGAWLLGMWGLPATLVEIVARHHEPGLAPPPLRALVMAVHVADALVGAPEEQALDQAFLAELGVADRVAGWRQLAERV